MSETIDYDTVDAAVSEFAQQTGVPYSEIWALTRARAKGRDDESLALALGELVTDATELRDRRETAAFSHGGWVTDYSRTEGMRGWSESDGYASDEEWEMQLTAAQADVAAVLRLTDYSDAERRQLAAKGWALPDGSYPVKNEQDAKNAAVLIRSKHGDWQAATRLLARRCKELGCANPLTDSDSAGMTLRMTAHRDPDLVMLSHTERRDVARYARQLSRLNAIGSGDLVALAAAASDDDEDDDTDPMVAGAEASRIMADHPELFPDTSTIRGKLQSMAGEMASNGGPRIGIRPDRHAGTGKFVPAVSKVISQGRGNNQNGLTPLDPAQVDYIDKVLAQAGYAPRSGNRGSGPGPSPSYQLPLGPSTPLDPGPGR